ncbi:MAG: hypothetical protein FJZ95_00045 [Chloroflexi bacterium]|nr:hypothetical protein [Chloroflexota bacterium]
MKKYGLIGMVMMLMALLALSVSPAFATPPTTEPCVWDVQLKSTDGTTWTYEVVRTSGQQGCGISHWDLGLAICLEADIISHTEPAGFNYMGFGTDGSCGGFEGLKWEWAGVGEPGDGPFEFSITLDKAYKQTTIDAVVKTGVGCQTIQVEGPSCDPVVEPECEYTLTLSPQTAVNDVGDTHAVTATLRKGPDPVEGATILIEIIDGPNKGVSGQGPTDVNGQLTLSYKGEEKGIDTIKATYLDHPCATAEASKTWETGGGSIPGIAGWSIIAMTGMLGLAGIWMLRKRVLT